MPPRLRAAVRRPMSRSWTRPSISASSSTRDATACAILERRPARPGAGSRRRRHPGGHLPRDALAQGHERHVGLDAMADLTHRMEDVLAAVRDAGAATTRRVIDALFGCLDALEAMMDAVACGDGAEVDATAVIAGLEAAAATAPASGPAATRADGASPGSRGRAGGARRRRAPGRPRRAGRRPRRAAGAPRRDRRRGRPGDLDAEVDAPRPLRRRPHGRSWAASA